MSSFSGDHLNSQSKRNSKFFRAFTELAEGRSEILKILLMFSLDYGWENVLSPRDFTISKRGGAFFICSRKKYFAILVLFEW